MRADACVYVCVRGCVCVCVCVCARVRVIMCVWMSVPCIASLRPRLCAMTPRHLTHYRGL